MESGCANILMLRTARRCFTTPAAGGWKVRRQA
jgi:hypothetical protein